MALASIYDILTTQWVKDTFLPGVDLTDDYGVPFPPQVFQESLRRAVSFIEQTLDIAIDRCEVKGERHDMHDQMAYAFYPLQLYVRPFRKLDKFQYLYGTVQSIDIPLSWLQVTDTLHARCNILPSADQILALSSTVLMPALYRPGPFVPAYFAIDYQAGFSVYTQDQVVTANAPSAAVTFAVGETFEKSNYFVSFALVNPQPIDADITAVAVQRTTAGFLLKLSRAPANNLTVRWFASEIPDDLRYVLGVYAATLPLTIAGDLVLGAGVASRSLGLDGLSQSINTTKSGPNGGAFKARIKDLLEDADRQMSVLKGVYRSARVTVL